jgi:hypothetical protein
LVSQKPIKEEIMSNTYLPNVGDRVTIAHPTFSGRTFVVRGVGAGFTTVAPEGKTQRGHVNFAFGVDPRDLRPIREKNN